MGTPAAATAQRHRIAVAGATGRMGQMLIEAVRNSADCELAGALDVPASPAIGNDAAAFLGHASGVRVTADLAAALANADVLIDFTRPEGTLAHLAACRERGVRMVIGTTGFDEAQKARIADAARAIAIVFAPNMSVGVNVTFKLLQTAAKALATGYDIEIVEAHHRHKIDAPSGTALRMGELIAQASGRKLEDCAVYGREGVTGERDPSTIGFSSVRGGDIVGDHTVLFAGTGERIEIVHRAASRATYAQGSLRAVRFLAGKKNGLFDMFDVLGLQGAPRVSVLQLLSEGDPITRLVAALLLAMSVASWVAILWKFWLLRRAAADVARATAAFWQSNSAEEARERAAAFDRHGLVVPLVHAVQVRAGGTLAAAGNRSQQLTRTLREALHGVLDKLHFGQVLLATVGSTAPFVGLLGTVWGIYHALTSIAGAGQISIDRVAGPVGEALVMTAAGLAVAIPAVLAYNVYGRSIARIEADLEGFARDLRELFAADDAARHSYRRPATGEGQP